MERQLILGIASFVAMLLISWAIALLILIRLPSDYLRASRIAEARRDRGPIDKAGRVAKTILGSMLVLIGGLLSIPPIPGPGFLIVVAGILLLDFPAKHRMLRKLVGRPIVLRSINRLRGAFAQAPLLID